MVDTYGQDVLSIAPLSQEQVKGLSEKEREAFVFRVARMILDVHPESAGDLVGEVAAMSGVYEGIQGIVNQAVDAHNAHQEALSPTK